MYLRSKNVRSWCDGSSDRSFMVNPAESCNKSRGVCYPVCGSGEYRIILAATRKDYPIWRQRLSSLAIYVRRHITINKNVLVRR